MGIAAEIRLAGTRGQGGSGIGVILRSAGEIEERFERRGQHVPRAAADTFGSDGKVEQGGHRGGELLAAGAAQGVGEGFQKQARSLGVESVIPAAEGTGVPMALVTEADGTLGHGRHLENILHTHTLEGSAGQCRAGHTKHRLSLAKDTGEMRKNVPRRVSKAPKCPEPQGLPTNADGEPAAMPGNGRSLAGQASCVSGGLVYACRP